MFENHAIQLAEVPIGGNGGALWNRLHEERENICEALIKSSKPKAQAHKLQKRLEARLRRIDRALDRLMSGSYGHCSTCGHSIESSTLEVDPAWALCSDCEARELNAASTVETVEMKQKAPRASVENISAALH